MFLQERLKLIDEVKENLIKLVLKYKTFIIIYYFDLGEMKKNIIQ